MSNLSLYDIGNEMKALFELLAMDSGEITEDHEDLEKECMDLVASKIDAIAKVKRTFKNDIEAAKTEIKRIQGFKTARENAIKRLEKLILGYMELTGETQIRGSMYEAKKRKPQKRVEITDKNKIPMEFTQVEVKYKTSEIKKALKNGEVDGAKLIDGKKSVSIKEKSIK